MRAFERGKPFITVKAEDKEHPVFSEANLYPRMVKCDARFILSVADEYSKLIEALGGEKVERILMAFTDDADFKTQRFPGYVCLKCGYERKESGLDILRPCPKCGTTLLEEVAIANEQTR